MKNETLNHYRNLSDYDKNNLENYMIYNGIFKVFPAISKEDVDFIFGVCKKVENENINLYSISHYITDNYMSGNITKNDLEKATSGDICSAVYFDRLDYLCSKKDKNLSVEYQLSTRKLLKHGEIEMEKMTAFNDLCGNWDFRNIDMTEPHLGGINYIDNKFYFIVEKFSPALDDYIMYNFEFNDVDLIDNFANLDMSDREEVWSFMSSCEMKIDWKKATETLEKLEEKEIKQEELEIEI